MFSEVFLRGAHGSKAKSEEIKCNLDFVEGIFANMIKCKAGLTGMVNLSLRSDRKLLCLFNVTKSVKE